MSIEKTTIAKSDDTPEVVIDFENNYMSIKGPSFPENAQDFYMPIINKFKDYNIEQGKEFVCDFDFSILSSSSNKMIFEFLLKLEKLAQSGSQVKIRWYYEGFDEDLMDEGQGFKDSLKLPFYLIEK